MNIGLFNDNFPPINDGVALTVKNYADNMHAKGEHISVVTAKAPRARYDYPYQVLPYTSFVVPQKAPYRWGLPQLDPILRYKLSHTPLDIIHAHCPFATGLLGIQEARRRHIPLVTTFHSKYRQDFEHSVKSERIVDQMVKLITNFYNHAYEVWVPQPAVEPVLREYGLTGHVEVMPNGNDFVSSPAEVEALRQHKRQELGLAPDDTMLLFVGQHIWEKNIGFIIDALKLISDMPWHLYMIGTGYAEGLIREKIHQMGLDHKVTMVGVIDDREQLKAFDTAADLFLFPSLYDNAPLVVREAAAMHTPALMLMDSTSAEIIQSGYNGFLTINDVHVYARTLSHLITHHDEIRRVGDNASMTIARSWSSIVDEVLLRYQDICRSYHA